MKGLTLYEDQDICTMWDQDCCTVLKLPSCNYSAGKQGCSKRLLLDK
jgi:hypothetical protein